ncbi:MAG TPA: septal ring lytic transglycosylase RlpA family protein [Alphaproteobacteria bacterium]|nr:septal ring lytic transglycosylase RlpA family protein [Alphaproteobacteria bacterium]
MKLSRYFILLLSGLLLSGCAELEVASHVVKKFPGTPGSRQQEQSQSPTQAGNFKVGKPYKVDGKWYTPKESYDFEETGIASWYGPDFHGKHTANGETYDQNELTAAHRTLQMPSFVRVTNLENGRSVIVRVNDRGPFKRSRVIDVSSKAADLLGFKGKGTAKVRLQVLSDESKQLAKAAIRGEDVRGTEVALNQGRQPTYMEPAAQPPGTYQTASLAGPIEREVLTPMPSMHMKAGMMYPNPVVSNMPVSPTTIYVQTGSFTNQANAARLAQQLQNYGPVQVTEALVKGQTFYRVRIPAGSVDEADILLDRLMREAGQPKAIITVH